MYASKWAHLTRDKYPGLSVLGKYFSIQTERVAYGVVGMISPPMCLILIQCDTSIFLLKVNKQKTDLGSVEFSYKISFGGFQNNSDDASADFKDHRMIVR